MGTYAAENSRSPYCKQKMATVLLGDDRIGKWCQDLGKVSQKTRLMYTSPYDDPREYQHDDIETLNPN